MEMRGNSFLGSPHRIEYLGEASTLIDSILETVEEIPIFHNFSYREIKILTAYMTCYGVAAGEEIITEGRAGDYLVLLLSGKVHLLRDGHDDTGTRAPASTTSGAADEKDKGPNADHGPNPSTPRSAIATAGPGTVLGELSMMDGLPRFSSCVTVTPTDFAMLDRRNLHRLLKDVPELGNRFLVALLQLFAGRLRETCDGVNYRVPRHVA